MKVEIIKEHLTVDKLLQYVILAPAKFKVNAMCEERTCEQMVVVFLYVVKLKFVLCGKINDDLLNLF